MVNDLFLVTRFFHTFTTHFSQPTLKRFCLWRRNRLDNSQQTFGISGLYLSHFAICGNHLNFGTKCTKVQMIPESECTFSLCTVSGQNFLLKRQPRS